MTIKFNGNAAGAEFVGGNVQFFTVTVSTPPSGLTLASQFDAAFDPETNPVSALVTPAKTLYDVAVEAIQGFTTPVILGALDGTNLIFRFASNYVVGTTEGLEDSNTVDTKTVSFAATIKKALDNAVKGFATPVTNANFTVAVVMSETI